MDRLTLGEVVDAAHKRVLDEGLTPREAAEKVLAEVRLDAAGAREAQIVGVSRLLATLMHHARETSAVWVPEGGGAEGPSGSEARDGSTRSGRVQLRTNHATEGAGAYYTLASTPYQGADGQVRMLIEFSADDWAHNATIASTMASGWRARADLFSLGMAEIKKHKATKTGVLPAASLAKLEAKAAEVFTRSSRAVAV